MSVVSSFSLRFGVVCTISTIGSSAEAEVSLLNGGLAILPAETPVPAVHYSFNEADGVEIKNDGAIRATGTLVGPAAVRIGNSPSASNGTALSFPPGQTYVDTNLSVNQAGLSGANFTVMAWVWADSEQAGDDGDAIIVGLSDGNAIRLGIRGDQYFFGYWNTEHGSEDARVEFKSWHHVAWRYQNDVISIYLDGSQVSSFRRTDFFALGIHSNVVIGTSQTDSDREFVGALDELRIYNEALEDAEIAVLARPSAFPPAVGMDSDGDGQLDEEERISGTNPNDPLDYLRMKLLHRTGTEIQI